jgi:hypothetical protein
MATGERTPYPRTFSKGEGGNYFNNLNFSFKASLLERSWKY